KSRPDSSDKILQVLEVCHPRDPERALHNLDAIAAALDSGLLREFMAALGRFMARSPDPDMALNSLERFLSQSAAVEQVPRLLEQRARLLETLVQLFSMSQSFSDLLTVNPDYLDMLKVPLRRSPSPTELREQLQAEVDAAFEDSAVLGAFRRF